MISHIVSRIAYTIWTRKLFTALVLVSLLVGGSNLIFFLHTAQARGNFRNGTVIINDFQGNDPMSWTSNRLTGQASAESFTTDPTYVYQAIFNGAQFDSGRDEVVDDAGNAYILARAYDTSNDVMVVKLSPTGSVLFVTYLRGSQTDYGTGLTLEGQDVLLVLPTRPTFQ